MEDLHNGYPPPQTIVNRKLNYFFLHVVIHTVSRHSNQYVHETNADTWFGSSRNVVHKHPRQMFKEKLWFSILVQQQHLLLWH